MPLQEKLDAHRETSHKIIPAEAQAVMKRATEDLRNTDILDRMIQPGDSLPSFALPNVHGEIITSQALLERGPLVVSFYRGNW